MTWARCRRSPEIRTDRLSPERGGIARTLAVIKDHVLAQDLAAWFARRAVQWS
ncbi:MAG TPA: hypothetical protein VGI52_04865 [Solirubrobacteraceae bacterium]